MQLRMGSELFWPPVGSPALYCNLLPIHSPGFAKRHSFLLGDLQGKLQAGPGGPEIDLKDQTVLLEDGQGESARAGRSQLGFQEAPGMWLLVGGYLGWSPQGQAPHPFPNAWKIAGMPPEPRPDPSGHRSGADIFGALPVCRHCLKPRVFSLAHPVTWEGGAPQPSTSIWTKFFLPSPEAPCLESRE